MKRFFNLQQRSISKEVTVGLIFIVAAVSSIALLISHQQAARRAERQLEAKADEYIAFLENILVLPLWNYDFETIEAVGRTYLQNDFVAGIRILDSKGNARFSKSVSNGPAAVNRTSRLFYRGISVGRVNIALTSAPLTQLRRQFSWSFGLTVAINLLSLVLMTGLLLRWSLKRPLSRMDRIVKDFAAGNYDGSAQNMPHVELKPLVETLNEMGGKIKQQMETISKAEKKYRSIFENAMEGIFQSTAEGRIISANPAFAQILGYPSPEALIENVTDIAHQHWVDPGKRRELARTLETGNAISGYEVEFYRRDGERLWISINARPIYDSNGGLQYFEGLVQDITHKKKSEAQLRQAQKMEAIGTLAGGIAHDFNNILGVIIGCSELVLQNIPDAENAKKDMETVLDAALRAKSLTRQILTFSRQSEGEPRPLLLSPFIKEIVKFLRATLPVTIQMRIDTVNCRGAVLSDPIQIQQILMNLCTNAAQAMGPEGGRLDITLEDIDLDAEAAARLPELDAGSHIRLTVRDNGHGMPEEILHRIFDPFFTTKKVGEGTGLGLSVVHGTVKKLNGSVWVESRVGKGTTFRVYLPRLEHPDIEIADEQVSDLPRGHETILLVDDEPVLVDILERILSGLGYHVEAQTRPQRALELFHDHPHRFDLLIADQTMPEMTGNLLVEAVRDINPRLPVILCTGLKDRNTEATTVAFGINRTLVKPIRRDELALIIREVLDE